MKWLRRWWQAHHIRLKKYQLPPTARGFQFGVLSCDDPQRIADFCLVRLPSFGYGYSIDRDDERWGQRALLYHSRQGFKIIWLFDRGSDDSAIAQLHRRS